MNDNEAIRILGLGSSFTGEEELAAYRELVKKYHPDNYDNASEEEIKFAHEKMIKINEAHDYLKKKYFTNPSDINKSVNITSSNSYSSAYNNRKTYNYSKEAELELEKYKQEVIKKIKERANIININIYPKYIHALLKDIERETNNIINIIIICKDKGDINRQYNFFVRSIIDKLTELLIEYCKINNLNYDFIRRRVNYNWSVSKFYEQLEQMKKQYEDRTKQLQDRLKKETEKYKEYIGYTHLKDFISETIEKVIIAIGKDDYLVEICIGNMHSIITEKFKEYFKEMLTKYAEKYKDYAGYNEYVKIRISGKIDSYTSYAKERDFAETQLEDFIKKFHDEIENIFARNFAIINRLNKIKKNFDDIPDQLEVNSFNNLYEELKNCEQRFNKGDDITSNLDDIERKLEKILQFNKNRELLNKAYNILITNYHNKLASISPINYKELQKVNEIFEAVIKIFAKLENQEIDIDATIDILSRITFNSYDEDMSLINSTNKINIASGVYIIKPEYMRNTFADESLFYLKEEDGNYYMYRTGTITTKEMMPIDKIKNKFISLEDFLQKAEYIGKEFDAISRYLVLYKLGQVYISRVSNITLFGIKQNINKKLTTPLDYSIYGGDYKDINELITAIKIQVEKSVITYENEEKRKDKNYIIK